MSTQVTHPVYAYYHTHWDREWYLPFRMYQVRLSHVVDSLLASVEAGAMPCFTLDGQTILLDDYLALRPQNKPWLQRFIETDRVSVGPWYVMPDCFLVGGESLIRNLQIGMSDAKAWGETTFTGYLPDTFGHPADLPMILNQFGIDSAIVWRGVDPPKPFFNWKSPSGDSVLTLHLTQGYFQHVFHMGEGPSEEQSAFDVWYKAVTQKADPGTPLLFSVGADHLGVVADAPKRLAALCPTIQAVTPDRFMQNARTLLPYIDALPAITGELHQPDGAYILPGVFSSRMYLKQQNRMLEWRLTRQLEPLLALMEVLGTPVPYTHELDLLWRTLIQNHPHDSICGCSVDAVHRENELRFAHVDQFSAMMLAHIHQQLKTHFEASGQTALLFNLSDRPYTGVVPLVGDFSVEREPEEASETSQPISDDVCLDETFMHHVHVLPLSERKVRRQTRLVWVDELAPHSTGRYTLPFGPTPDPVTVTDTTLENQHVCVSVAQNGTLTILDKKQGRTYTGLHHVVRRPQQGDSYNAAPLKDSEWEVAQLTGVTIAEFGPLRGVLALNYYFPLGGFGVSTQVFLVSGSQGVDFETTFVNVLPDQIVQVVFTADAPVTEVTAEGHFSPVVRTYDPTYQIEQHMPAPAQTELAVQAGAIQRVIQWQGQTLITQGLAEYTVEDNTVLLTLVRAFGMLSRDDTGVRGSHAGPPLPTPEGQCLDRTMGGCYRWLPDITYTDALVEADWFYGGVYGFDAVPSANEASSALPESASLRQWITWDNPQIHASACTPTSKGMRVRLVNPTQSPQTTQITVPTCTATCHAENLLGADLGQITENTLTLAPFSVQTVLVRIQ